MADIAKTKAGSDEQATKKEDVRVTHSSGNVFADLGLPNPEVLLQKTKLVLAISDTIKARGLTQADAGKIMGVSQPDLSKLLRGRTVSFTLDRLVGMLNELGMDVDVIVRAHVENADDRGKLRVLQVVG